MSTAMAVEGKGAQAPDLPAMEMRLRQQVQDAQQRLARAVSIGTLRNDPLADVVEAVSQSLGVQCELHISCVREYRAAAAHLDQQLRTAVEDARQPLDPAALVRLEKAAVTGTDRRAADLARSRNRRTLLLGGLAVVVGLVAAVGGGALWGAAGANERVHETERRLVIAFQDGPDAAAAWVNLMEQNNVVGALSVCRASHTFVDQTGRKACLMPVYPEAPTRPVPAPSRR